MDQNQACQRREVLVKHAVRGDIQRYKGDEVYSVTSLGIVVAAGTLRLFYPWHRVELFTYHTEDARARMVVQGY